MSSEKALREALERIAHLTCACTSPKELDWHSGRCWKGIAIAALAASEPQPVNVPAEFHKLGQTPVNAPTCEEMNGFLSKEYCDAVMRDLVEPRQAGETSASREWGFYCDFCKKFFDLFYEGQVKTHEGNTCTHWHKICGKQARYISYHDLAEPATPKPPEGDVG